MAYWEQVGVKRQQGRNIGEMNNWYHLINPIAGALKFIIKPPAQPA
jgi:hypothetical protein